MAPLLNDDPAGLLVLDFTASAIHQPNPPAMKPTIKHTLLTLLSAALLPLTAARGDNPPGDPFSGAFFPPELILQTRDQIGFSQDQLMAFQALVEKTQPRSNELQQRLERETAALAALAKPERVTEAPLLAQLDKVLDAERDLKHLHIGLLVAIKNLLTPDQQEKLRAITHAAGARNADETRKRLTEKVVQVQAGAQLWLDSGRDASPIARAMQEECKPLLDAGKVREAEAVLDRLLQQLQAGNK